MRKTETGKFAQCWDKSIFFSEYVCAINCLIKYIFLSLKVVIYLKNLSDPSMKR